MSTDAQVRDPKDWQCDTCGRPLNAIASMTSDQVKVTGDCPVHGRVWGSRRGDVRQGGDA